MLADNARLLVEAKGAAEVKKSEAAAKLASEAKKIFELSSYDAPIAPSQVNLRESETCNLCLNTTVNFLGQIRLRLSSTQSRVVQPS